MKRQMLLCTIAIWLCQPVRIPAQIQLDTSMTVTELISEVLVSGGVQVFDVTVAGNPSLQLARFDDPDGHLGFHQGIYLTSGRVDRLNLPPDSLSASLIDSTSGDDDLAQLVDRDPREVNDAIVIEFSFIPVGDSISFKYVFASEEYPEYVCSQYNDAFGFFLSGPGLAGDFTDGAVNLATVPGTELPVAVNTINSGAPGIYGDEEFCTSTFSEYFVNNILWAAPPIINTVPVVYNGYTQVMTAQSAVRCGETYRIKLVIADLFDGSLDSGVFLEAESFSSAYYSMYLQGLAVDNSSGSVFEGCPVEVRFSRPVSMIDESAVVPLLWSGTAEHGSDYSGRRDSLYFPVGIASVSLELDIMRDELAELQETININIPTDACGGQGLNFSIAIRDPELLSLTLMDSFLVSCEGSVMIEPAINGGTGNYLFEWMTESGVPVSSNQDFGPLMLADTGLYTLKIIDQCSTDTVSTQIAVWNGGNAAVQLLSENACAGDSVRLGNNSHGLSGFSWFVNGYHISSSDDAAFLPVTPGYYEVLLVATDPGNCLPADSATTVVEVADSVYATFALDASPCLLAPLNAYALYSEPGTDYLWTAPGGRAGVGRTFQPVFNEPGTYVVSLSVVSEAGCSDTFQKAIEVDRGCGVYLPSAFTPDGDGVNDLFNLIDNGIPEFRLEVFDRWGRTVFLTTSYAYGWDGTIGGRSGPMDVYVYTIEGTANDGSAFSMSGEVLLLR